jgi:hypothetical protein
LITVAVIATSAATKPPARAIEIASLRSQ